MLWLERWVLLGVLIGIIGGLCALAFNYLIAFFEHIFLHTIVGFYPPCALGECSRLASEVVGEIRHHLIPLVTAIGGLLSGLLVFTWAPEAEGHGTDAVIEALHRQWGHIRRRVPLIKMLASAITIGSGGSAGREGPVAQVGAGLASWIAELLHLKPEERRLLTICGLAAGIGAIFKAPLGAAIFAIEVPYKRDFEVEAFVPVVISSIVAYAVFSAFRGTSHIFEIPHHGGSSVLCLPLFALEGLIAGLMAIVYVRVFYGLRDKVFRRLAIPRLLLPAIGGLLTGVIGMIVPHVLGVGYGWTQQALLGQLTFEVALALMLLKIVATSFTIGSGGSGGVFAPSLYIGAMLGAAFGDLASNLLDIISPETELLVTDCVLVGMAAFFAGAAKAPLASIMMVAEMTGGYELLVPAVIASVISYVVSGDHTIYESQVRNRLESVAHLPRIAREILGKIRVGEVMSHNVICVHPDDSASVVVDLIRRTGHTGYPVVSEKGVVGIVTYREVLRADLTQLSKIRVRDIMVPAVTVTPDQSLFDALETMREHGITRLVVVDSHTREPIGIITGSDIASISQSLLGIGSPGSGAIRVDQLTAGARGIQPRSRS